MKIFAVTATILTMSAALVAVFFLYDIRNDIWFQYHSTQRLNVAMQAMHATIARVETLETQALKAATKDGPKEAKVVQMCRDDIVDGDSYSRGRQIAAMMKDGWQYVGPLHANGINCSMNLFVR